MISRTHCGACHAVRGTEAEGVLGPDLSHLMTRTTIASGVLPNDGPTLAHWIADPQSLKPGSLMPAPALSGAGTGATSMPISRHWISGA